MSIYPTLRYRDPRAAIEFLTSAFGLKIAHLTDNPDGTVGHAELSWGNGVVMLGTKSADPGPWDTERCVLYLVVDDPDAHHARAVAAGATVIMELTDQPYGSREFAATDPEGNVWSFGTYQPKPAS